MKIQLLIGLFILSSFQILQAARPTVNASNLFNNTTGCTSATISWSNGNGNARMIVAREGSPVSFVPSDYNQYGSGSAVFGGSTPVGQNSNDYILMNSVGMSTLNITNLKSGSTYYFAIYEHDNNGSNVLYLTSGAATHSFTTHYINQNFSIVVNDSCEASNQFVFTNTSSTSIQGLQYTFLIDGTTYNADQAVTYSFKNKNGFLPVLLKNNNTIGCPNNLSKNVKLFPRQMATFDFANSSDTVQDFIDNYFNIRTKPKAAPFPMSVTFIWSTGDGESTLFSTLRYSYTEVGRFHTRLIATAGVNTKLTGCKDTMYLDLVVTGSKPFRNLVITPDTMDLSTNNFSYSLSDTLVTGVVWQFGDGDTSHRKVTTHTYKDSGTYKVTVTATMLNGKSATTTKKLRVNFDTKDSRLAIVHPLINLITIYPNPVVNDIRLQFESDEWHELEIMGLNGQVYHKSSSTNKQETINTENWPSGTYIISIQDKNLIKRSVKISIVH